MQYQEALDYLYNQLPMFQTQGKKALKKDLRNIIQLCDWLGNPQDNYPCIHIAGTNGKGSVSHYLASILSMHGYKVGLYTSPHYRDFRERIKIDKNLLDKSSVKEFVSKFKAYQVSNPNFHPSFFELTVAMAFWAFYIFKVDIVILETGLGGTLDSTNIVLPIISVITNISLDHQWTLGYTLPEIAKEKAGIIKKDIPVIIGEYQKEVQAVFEKKARSCTSDLAYANEIITTKNSISTQSTKNKTVFHEKGSRKKVAVQFDVHFEVKNFQTALATLHSLENNAQKSSFTLSLDYPKIERKFKAELKKWHYLGRMQWISKSPKIIVDSAHNEGGLKEFFKFVSDYKYDQLHIIIGFVNDKELDTVLGFFPKEARYYFVAAKIPRAMKTERLEAACEEYYLEGKSYASSRHALAAAKRRAHKNDLICVVGSIFVVAEVV